jgi:hypothetical protein
MVGVVIDHKVVGGAIPAPVRGERPIEIGNLEGKTAGEPEAAMVSVETLNAIAVRWAKMFEASMFIGMGDDVAPVVRGVVPVPVIVVYVGNAVDAATWCFSILGLA